MLYIFLTSIDNRLELELKYFRLRARHADSEAGRAGDGAGGRLSRALF